MRFCTGGTMIPAGRGRKCASMCASCMSRQIVAALQACHCQVARIRRPPRMPGGRPDRRTHAACPTTQSTQSAGRRLGLDGLAAATVQQAASEPFCQVVAQDPLVRHSPPHPPGQDRCACGPGARAHVAGAGVVRQRRAVGQRELEVRAELGHQRQAQHREGRRQRGQRARRQDPDRDLRLRPGAPGARRSARASRTGVPASNAA